ncbi:MAG: uridine kinase [Acidobacteria bacterium]|nr:uridine kinase [Acidobacteriota bacterium]MYD70909.1 uridine kinase [Acidobacteriota bacterium]MYJ05514.1 uridine kinase [Acidobacteriota bacterium]
MWAARGARRRAVHGRGRRRAPWVRSRRRSYTDAPMRRPHLIAIAGASGAGKTTLAHHLADALEVGPAAVIPMDAYYRDHPEYDLAKRAAANYDSPDSIDVTLLRRQLDLLRAGRPAERPVYDFRTHRRTEATISLRPLPFLLLEGLLVLHWPAIRGMADTRVYIEIDQATALARRIARDRRERGRDEASVHRQWRATVWPGYLRWIAPSARFAHMTVDGAAPLEACVAAAIDQVRASAPATSAARSRSKTRAN